MSLWQFNAATGGYAKANRSEDEQGISTDEAAALAAWIDERPSWH
jgi:hypothetical protein